MKRINNVVVTSNIYDWLASKIMTYKEKEEEKILHKQIY